MPYVTSPWVSSERGLLSVRAGILWLSRQAELTGPVGQEVAVIVADRVSQSRGDWTPGTPERPPGPFRKVLAGFFSTSWPSPST